MRVSALLALLVVAPAAIAQRSASTSGHTWSGTAERFTDATFSTEAGGAPVSLEIQLAGSDEAAGTARFGSDDRCAYRLVRANTREINSLTVVTYAAEYAGSFNLAAMSGVMTVTALCGHAAARGQLIAARIPEGLSAGFVGDGSGGQGVYLWGVLPTE